MTARTKDVVYYVLKELYQGDAEPLNLEDGLTLYVDKKQATREMNNRKIHFLKTHAVLEADAPELTMEDFDIELTEDGLAEIRDMIFACRSGKEEYSELFDHLTELQFMGGQYESWELVKVPITLVAGKKRRRT